MERRLTPQFKAGVALEVSRGRDNMRAGCGAARASWGPSAHLEAVAVGRPAGESEDYRPFLVRQPDRYSRLDQLPMNLLRRVLDETYRRKLASRRSIANSSTGGGSGRWPRGGAKSSASSGASTTPAGSTRRSVIVRRPTSRSSTFCVAPVLSNPKLLVKLPSHINKPSAQGSEVGIPGSRLSREPEHISRCVIHG